MTKITKTVDNTIKAEDVKATATKVTTKVSEGAREFVRRSAATAKERSDDLYDTTTKFNSGLENALTSLAGGYVSILGGIASATHDNVGRSLTAVQKLANAKSVSEAIRIQSDYLRENTTANVAHVRGAAENMRDVAGNSVAVVRESAMKAWPYGKKAA